MAAVSALCFSRQSSGGRLNETKTRAYIHYGEAPRFHEWEFKALWKARLAAAIVITRSTASSRPHADAEEVETPPEQLP